VVAIGVAVFIAASDAYRNLNDSFARAYSTQRLPDVVLSGPAAPSMAAEISRLPGNPVMTVRAQTDIGTRIRDHTLLGRVVSVPDGSQPEVARIALRSGDLPSTGEVLVEQHLADHFHLRPGDTIELYGSKGWTPVTVSGTGLSTEYFWPARSQQELMTSAEQFGVVFAPQSLARNLDATPQHQLAVYAHDRGGADALITEVTKLAREHDLAVTTRSDQPSYVALDQDVKTFGEFANLLPALFLLAAVLGAFILLSRLVHAQRAIIGTLSANGIAPRILRGHYLAYGFAAGAAAIVPGVLGGVALGAWFTTQYTDAIGLPLHVTSVHPTTVVIGACAAIAATTLAAWAPARAAARTTPAEAMRFSPTGSGRLSLLERMLPPVRRLPARWRMVARGASRNRRRALFTIAGVAVSLSLVIVFAGLRDTVANVLDRQYGAVDRSDGQLYAAPGAASEVISAARADPAVAALEPSARLEAALEAGDRRYDTIITGLETTATLHHFVDESGHDLRLSATGGLLLGRGLRNLLEVREGDHITITTVDGSRLTEPVAGFVDEPLTAVAYVSLEHLDTVLGGPTATGALVQVKPGVAREEMAHRLGLLPGAAAYIDNAAIEATMRDAFAIMDVLVGVMLAFAIVMSVALLFNAMSANLAERSVELGTLNAAGMTQRILGRLVMAENMFLTLAGIPIGLVTGIVLARWFMSNYENLGYRWELRMQTSTLILIVLALLAASLVSQLSVLRGIKRINVAAIVRERSL
jgi:putative ABC transport system permease protein